MMSNKSKKGIIKDWLIVLVLLLDDVAALVLVFLVLWFFRVSIPLWSMIVLGLLLGTSAFIIQKVVVPSFHRKQVTGSEGMIGLEGEVVEPLKPLGVVRVEGEYWKAKSVDGDIASGKAVEILKLNRLVLEVRRKSR
ncbi:hypothetical protein ES703_13356 [subsurface metagenome]